MKKALCSLIFLIIVPFLCGMEQESCLQLSLIEKQLIVKEIERRGKDTILAEIYKKSTKCTPLVYDEASGLCCFRYCMNFNINKMFYKKDAEKDLLTKQIFDIIEVIEKEIGDRPEWGGDSRFTVLGKRTLYWWLQDAHGNFLPAIQVKFRPHYRPSDQKGLENFINSDYQ